MQTRSYKMHTTPGHTMDQAHSTVLTRSDYYCSPAGKTNVQNKLISQAEVISWQLALPHFFNEAKSCKQQITEHLNYLECFDQIILPNNMLHLSTQSKNTALNCM